MSDAFYERLSSLDRSLLELEGASHHMHAATVLVFDAKPLGRNGGGVDIERIRARVAACLHRAPRYRQRLIRVPFENQPVLVDDVHFHLDYHVRHTCLPQPGDERQLKHLAGAIMSQQLDRAKPLWELWVVEGLGGGRVALVSKTHHAMIDGVASRDLLELLLDAAPRRRSGRAPPFAPRPAPSESELLLSEWTRRVPSPLGVARDLAQTLLVPRALVGELAGRVRGVAEALGVGTRRASATPLNQRTGPHRSFDWIAMDLDDVRAVKRRLGGTLHDVVMGTVAGAVRLFLEKRRVDVDALDFRAMTPVSKLPSEAGGGADAGVYNWGLELPVSERDPVERLRLVREATGELAAAGAALPARALARGSEFRGPTLLALGARAAANAPAFNLMVVNVPGPQAPLYLLGAQLQNCYPLVPLGPDQGLGVALFSYHGRLFWGFNADSDVLPDLPLFADSVVAAFNELREAS